MNRPNGYGKAQVAEWEPMKAGGHKCIIKQVQETKSKNGLSMLIISFDTDKEDIQPGYYTNQYMKDTQAGRDAKWRGTGYLVTDPGTEYGTANLKRFNTAVEHSNTEQALIAKGWNKITDPDTKEEGLEPAWGDRYPGSFKDLKVGIVFRREFYTADDGQSRASMKPFRYCNYDKAFEQKVPEDKLTDDMKVQPSTAVQPPAEWTDPHQMTNDEFFQSLSGAAPDPLADEGLPFM